MLFIGRLGELMNLKEQSYVLAIEKYRNITKAAQELGISQPALTIFLNRLEEEEGAHLFERGKKNLELTPLGEIYVDKAKQMMILKNEFEIAKNKIEAKDISNIRLGIQEIRESHIIPPLILACREQMPTICLDFFHSYGENLYKMLEGDKIDLLLSTRWRKAPSMKQKLLKTEKLLFITSSELIPNLPSQEFGQEYPHINLSSYRDKTFIMLPEGYTTRHFANMLFEQLGWKPKKMEEYRKTEIMIRMIEANKGVGFILEGYLPYFVSKHELRCFTVGEPVIETEFVAVYPKEKEKYASFCKLLDILSFIFGN